MFNHNLEFRAELEILDDPDEADDFLADDADDSSDIASPIRYVKRIRFQVYKHYASEHNLPWGANNYEDLPHCIVAWTRLMFRAPAQDASMWNKNRSYYIIYKNKIIFVGYRNPIQHSNKKRKVNEGESNLVT